MRVIAIIVAPGSSSRRARVTGREVGRVAALWRYPVKSMAAEALERVEVGWHGIAGDRRWAFVRADQERNGFPWLTIRELPELARYQPRLADLARPDAAAVRVRTPAGAESLGRGLDAADSRSSPAGVVYPSTLVARHVQRRGQRSQAIIGANRSDSHAHGAGGSEGHSGLDGTRCAWRSGRVSGPC